MRIYAPTGFEEKDGSCPLTFFQKLTSLQTPYPSYQCKLLIQGMKYAKGIGSYNQGP